ncbi:MAG: hypothetical protein FJ160_01410 [Gammaproteobacteria bacterium]|nr:hypothetical protein [Gammaproteobacteria bacterium]
MLILRAISGYANSVTAARERYRSRLSGSLLDRMDLRVELYLASNADLVEY